MNPSNFSTAVWRMLLCFLAALLLNLNCLHGQISTDIDPGNSITAGSGSSWRSPSGDFAFGFYLLPSGFYLLGIWFDKLPGKTLVWSANRKTPAEGGSTVSLTTDGQLVLTYVNGTSVTINSEAAASIGSMQDNGNFVLKDGSSVVVWQSFDSPTDTLLPGQILRGDQELYSNARGSEDYSIGNFMLKMQAADGRLVLSAYHFGDPGYWITDPVEPNARLEFNNRSALMYLVNSTGDIFHSFTTNMSIPVEDYYHRATFDEHGNFQQLVYHKTNGSGWTSVWRAFDDPCLVNAICGVYGMCISSDNDTMTCDCLPGYTPLDPNNVYKGCRTKTVVNYCAGLSSANFTVEVIDDADFPPESFADMARIQDVDVEGCKKAVMDDCYSFAAVLKGSRCNKKRMPLLNARKSASAKGIKALIKVPVPINMSNPDIQKATKKNNSLSQASLEIGLIISAIIAFLFGAAAFYYNPGTQRLIKRKHSLNLNTIGINFREFTFQELHKATNGFSKILGRGSSGKVYSGILALKDANIEVAVKKLEKDIEKTKEEFMTELKIIGRTHHRNLVTLFGFCNEKGHHLLVYELMPNGTLSDFLFGKAEKPGWAQRAEMALGIARGLLYLHEESETQIIHCDIKPENVLLDKNYIAKISDFGLSKLLNKDQTRTDTNMRGTMGYIAPEWLRNVPVTTKVDVFSFGVMLLEIICCRRHIELNRVEEETEEDDLVLSDWVLSCVNSRNLQKLVRHDPEVLSDFQRFERMVMVGLWCIHPDPILRPFMKKVTQMLEGTLEVAIPPLLNDFSVNY